MKRQIHSAIATVLKPIALVFFSIFEVGEMVGKKRPNYGNGPRMVAIITAPFMITLLPGLVWPYLALIPLVLFGLIAVFFVFLTAAKAPGATSSQGLFLFVPSLAGFGLASWIHS